MTYGIWESKGAQLFETGLSQVEILEAEAALGTTSAAAGLPLEAGAPPSEAAAQQQARWAHTGLQAGVGMQPAGHMARPAPEEEEEGPDRASAIEGLQLEPPGSGHTGWLAGACWVEHYRERVPEELMPGEP